MQKFLMFSIYQPITTIQQNGSFNFAQRYLNFSSLIVSENKGIKSIGLTGGVSYNIPISDMVEKNVRKTDLKLIIHNNIPNGDGGISIGQNAIIGHKLNESFIQ